MTTSREKFPSPLAGEGQGGGRPVSPIRGRGTPRPYIAADRSADGTQDRRLRTVVAILISEYDPAWPERFRAYAAALRGELGARAARIDHIGSTSVPGLAAKDVIDVQVS